VTEIETDRKFLQKETKVTKRLTTPDQTRRPNTEVRKKPEKHRRGQLNTDRDAVAEIETDRKFLQKVTKVTKEDRDLGNNRENPKAEGRSPKEARKTPTWRIEH